VSERHTVQNLSKDLDEDRHHWRVSTFYQ